MRISIINTLYVFLFAISPLFANIPSDSKHVVIIGAGPSGLATAIEAYQSGHRVTILEKRPSYTRFQVLFLSDFSLDLLEKWGVSIQQMNVFQIGEGNRLATVPIKHLEEAFDSKCKSLEIQKIQGEFIGFSDDKTIVYEDPDHKYHKVSYDILIGADGTHSSVRENLKIECHRCGNAKGAVAFMRFDKPDRGFGITDTLKRNDLFVRKIQTVPKNVYKRVHFVSLSE